MQENNTVETRNAVNNTSGLSQVLGFLGGLTQTAAGVYQAKLANESAVNRSTGTGLEGVGGVTSAQQAARDAWAKMPWLLPAILLVGLLVAVGLLRRR